jgi:hypothetical protein
MRFTVTLVNSLMARLFIMAIVAAMMGLFIPAI